jgi:hypothetical protein
MFGFKSAQQKRIDELAAENAALRNGMEGADATAVMYSDMLSDERRQHEMTRANLTSALASEEHWQIEASRLTGELASARAELAKYKRGLSMGTEASAARRRFDKECREQVADRKTGTGAFANPNGTAAAVQGVSHQPV